MEQGRFPNKLKRYRRIAGYSQKKVARVLGLADTSMISRWEQGAVLPSLLYTFKLSKLYHTLPHELFDLLWN
jgi:DNA-binding XRE family transcriptional regulator